MTSQLCLVIVFVTCANAGYLFIDPATNDNAFPKEDAGDWIYNFNKANVEDAENNAEETYHFEDISADQFMMSAAHDASQIAETVSVQPSDSTTTLEPSTSEIIDSISPPNYKAESIQPVTYYIKKIELKMYPAFNLTVSDAWETVISYPQKNVQKEEKPSDPDSYYQGSMSYTSEKVVPIADSNPEEFLQENFADNGDNALRFMLQRMLDQREGQQHEEHEQ